ncbi:hypothetical protein HDU76_013951, partial [Blyttiomyces sp. JEL0837]
MAGCYLSVITPAIGNAKKLETLNLSWNLRFFKLIGNLANLVSLNLNNNPLTGPVPSFLGNLEGLSYLDLANTFLSGSIPSTLGDMKNMSSLSIANTRVSGPLPEGLSRLSKLTTINFSNNNISGGLPDSYSNISTLQAMYLNSNFINGTIPPSIAELPNLRIMLLNDNCLDDNSISQILMGHGFTIGRQNSDTLYTVTQTTNLDAPTNGIAKLPSSTSNQKLEFPYNSIIGVCVAFVVLVMVVGGVIWRRRKLVVLDKNAVPVETPAPTPPPPPLTQHGDSESIKDSVIHTQSQEKANASDMDMEADDDVGDGGISSDLLVYPVQEDPTIALEVGLQRTYGVYTGWSHNLIMEWARQRNFTAAVIQVFK